MSSDAKSILGTNSRGQGRRLNILPSGGIRIKTCSCTHLPLSERDGVELVTAELLVLRVLEEAHGGVGAWGQDEDEGAAAAGVVVGLGQVEGRRLHELLTQLLHHEIRHGLDNL